jgi:glycosyltransferase involved in cell wall biosynthesis
MPQDRSSDAGVMWLGHQPRESVLELLRGALLLIVPSEWYEGSPLTVMDAFAVGTPVLASRIGSLAEIIEDRVSGLLFEPGSPDALARSVEWARARPAELLGMARRARHEFETKYTAQSTYAALTRIYADAIQSRENGHGSQTDRSSTRRTVHFSSDSGAGPSPG